MGERERADIVGQPVFEAFPPSADTLEPSGVSRIQLSFEKALATGRPDVMPIQKYDVPDQATGGRLVRYWSLISVPVAGPDGSMAVGPNGNDDDIALLVLQVDEGRSGPGRRT